MILKLKEIVHLKIKKKLITTIRLVWKLCNYSIITELTS